MTSTVYRGELLLTQEESNDFKRTLENACLKIYGLQTPFIPWRMSPIDQPIRAHTPSSISLATVLRELDATIDPSEIIKQPLNRRSSFKQEPTPSPRPTAPPSPKKPEVKPEVKKRPTFVLDEKIEYEVDSDFYKLLNPPEDKLKELPEWARKIHKILREACYQPYAKPFLKYFKKKTPDKTNNTENPQAEPKPKKPEKADDLDFDDLSDDLHDILMDIDNDANNAVKEVEENKDLDSELVTPKHVDNYVKIDTIFSVENAADSFNTEDLNTLDHTTTDQNNKPADKDLEHNAQPNNEFTNTQLNSESTNTQNHEPVTIADVEVEPKDWNVEVGPKEWNIEVEPKEWNIEDILESLLMNEFENSSKVFSLIYMFLVRQFKVIPPGTLDWMCAQDMSNKLEQLRIEEGLLDSEKLHSFPDESVDQPTPQPVPESPLEVKKPRTSMEDFEHEISLINKSDDHNSTISLPEVKIVTDEERMEFYNSVMELDQEYQLELFTVFEHAAVWKIVGNGEIELDDRNTDPKIYRGMIKWVKEKKKAASTTFEEPEMDLSKMTSEIAV